MEKGESIVVVKGVSKNYGKVEALKEVSFAVERGEIFGLIGPDGAGKSTLFRILTTLLLADKGTAIVNGLDVVTDYKLIRTKVGYMPEDSRFIRIFLWRRIWSFLRQSFIRRYRKTMI